MFPIVGIGASAGGLDAFRRFFAAMPADSGAAFVLIQHLDPTRKSLTSDLVGSSTKMRVVQATDGLRVEANRVYVIPPNAYLSLGRERLRLSAPTAPRSLRMAVDFFFHSLAEELQEDAIGVVLSGTGTDGTLGLKEIKAAGGMTMVQEPQSAQHDGMPRSAIAAGCSDYVLPPEEMAGALLAYLRHAAVAAKSAPVSPEKAPDPLAGIVDVLRRRLGFDFSGYKKGTLQRRIQRRMSLRHLNDLAKYAELLLADATEATALFKDLLINVTGFFREPAAWRFLQEQVIRPLVAAKQDDAPLRVWIPACSTGEEAYSLAILLLEEIEAAERVFPLQVFASDVDADTLATARTGIYPEGIAAQVAPRRLSRFFQKRAHSYQVVKELRDVIVFAQQNLVSDPPFSRLDLISCRNLFIYLEPALQERLVPLLHFALREGGYLFLGSAEGIGPQEDLFETVSSKWRVHRRLGPVRRGSLPVPLATTPARSIRRAPTASLPGGQRLTLLAQQLLLQRYAPACVIINRAGEILYFHGRTDDYLTQPSGLPTRDLLAQARHGLRTQLRGALQAAIRDHQPVAVAAVQMRRGNAFLRVKVTVEPLQAANAESDGLWLVSLEDEADVSIPATEAGAEPQSATPQSAADPIQLLQLESELKSTKEDLQQTIEDLRASNEELMSVNEEFQSSNEELETSKEELQSLNEELTTANAQLGSKVSELEATNNDLDNLLTSTNIATLFLDPQLRLRRFTPAATQLFSLIATDIGRPLADIAQKFTDPELLVDAASVLQRTVAPKTEVQSHDGRWYVRQVLPYRVGDKHTEGVVITFPDVAAEALHEARLYAESIVDTVREALLVLDADLRVQSANQPFYRTFRTSQEETVGRLLYELGGREWDLPALRTMLADVLPRKRVLTDYELKADFGAIGPRIMQLNARVLDRGGGRAPLILLAIEDVTERRRTEDALRESDSRKQVEEQIQQHQAELAHALRVSTIGELASGLAHELNQPLSAIANGVEACARYIRAGKIEPKALLALLDDASGQALRAGSIVEHLRQFIEKGQPQMARMDLREIARNIPRLLAREIEGAQITLRLSLPARPVPVLTDRIQIEQILVNLMQNAIDAIREAPGEGGEIQMRMRVTKGVAEVAVRDSGAGVAAAAAEHLFDPFFTTKAHGLGMGLAISRSILEAHRGRIWIEPRRDGGRGATARFTLPLHGPLVAPKRRRSG